MSGVAVEGDQFAGPGIDLQHGAVDRLPYCQLFQGCPRCRQFAPRDIELAFGHGWQRRIGSDPAKFVGLLREVLLRTPQSQARRLHICIRAAPGPPVGDCLVNQGLDLQYGRLPPSKT